MKKIALLLAGVICACTIAGCVSVSGIVDGQREVNELLPTVSYKQDVNTSFGRTSAIYKNDIYYFTDKKSEAGIYKRNMNSEKEELIIETESIRKIQITEEGIYYIGRTKENDIRKRNTHSRWDTHQLFFHKGHEKESEPDKLMFDAMFAWDFYVTDCYIYLADIICTIPAGQEVLEKYLLDTQGKNLNWFDLNDLGKISNKIDDVHIYRKKNLAFCADSHFNAGIYEGELGRYTNEGIPMLYDSKIGKIVCMAIDTMLEMDDGGYKIMAEYEYPGKYILTKENEVIMGMDGEIYEREELEGVEDISFLWKEGELCYLLCKTEEGESIYRLDLNTFQADELQKESEKEKVLTVTKGKYVTATSKKLFVKDLETGEILQEQKWDKKVNFKKDKVELTGNYVFVYESGEELSLKNMTQIVW